MRVGHPARPRDLATRTTIVPGAEGLWWQLTMIVHGAILTVAGLVIAKIGITSVFIADDLEFLCTTPDRLWEVNERIIPLVAHDRATFGGMLLSVGCAVTFSGLWGPRRGRAWLWWMLLIAGSVAYVATIAIHHHVGYTSFRHLLPAYGGLVLLWGGSASGFAFAHAQNTDQILPLSDASTKMGRRNENQACG